MPSLATVCPNLRICLEKVEEESKRDDPSYIQLVLGYNRPMIIDLSSRGVLRDLQETAAMAYTCSPMVQCSHILSYGFGLPGHHAMQRC